MPALSAENSLQVAAASCSSEAETNTGCTGFLAAAQASSSSSSSGGGGLGVRRGHTRAGESDDIGSSGSCMMITPALLAPGRDGGQPGSNPGGATSQQHDHTSAAASTSGQRGTAAYDGAVAAESGTFPNGSPSAECTCPRCGCQHLYLCTASGVSVGGEACNVAGDVSAATCQQVGCSFTAAIECRACRRAGGEQAGDALLLCAGCGGVKYCSRECQRRDWKRHRKICRQVQQRKQQQQ
jgi:hypothetical protein